MLLVCVDTPDGALPTPWFALFTEELAAGAKDESWLTVSRGKLDVGAERELDDGTAALTSLTFLQEELLSEKERAHQKKEIN